MKQFLGFLCAIAIVCLAVGCGDGKSPAKSPEKSPAGDTTQMDEGPNATADSVPAPEQNAEPAPNGQTPEGQAPEGQAPETPQDNPDVQPAPEGEAGQQNQ